MVEGVDQKRADALHRASERGRVEIAGGEPPFLYEVLVALPLHVGTVEILPRSGARFPLHRDGEGVGKPGDQLAGQDRFETTTLAEEL